MTQAQKPLAGLKVVELGTLIAGPFCGRIMAEFGAEVIKVEPIFKGRGEDCFSTECKFIKYRTYRLWSCNFLFNVCSFKTVIRFIF